MKILVADRISPTGVAYLKQQPGFDVVEAYGSQPEQVLALVRDVDAIVVRSETQITSEVIAATIGPNAAPFIRITAMVSGKQIAVIIVIVIPTQPICRS